MIELQGDSKLTLVESPYNDAGLPPAHERGYEKCITQLLVHSSCQSLCSIRGIKGYVTVPYREIKEYCHISSALPHLKCVSELVLRVGLICA